MPNVGWSLEQRAAVKRWMLFASLFAVAGVILSVILIAAGNSGGWVLLLLAICIYGGLPLRRKHQEETASLEVSATGAFPSLTALRCAPGLMESGR
jgi:hypothetical protein